MGLDEDLGLIIGILAVIGLIPFLMEWLERTMIPPRPAPPARTPTPTPKAVSAPLGSTQRHPAPRQRSRMLHNRA